jgi:NAD(P)H-flavin reductase
MQAHSSVTGQSDCMQTLLWADGVGIAANCSAIKEFSTRQIQLYTCVKTQKLNYKLMNFCSNDNAFFFFFLIM